MGIAWTPAATFIFGAPPYPQEHPNTRTVNYGLTYMMILTPRVFARATKLRLVGLPPHGK